MTDILVVDGTGRGHALCDLFTRTDPAARVYYGPGCDVIDHPRIVPVPELSLTDPGTAEAFLARHPVDFVFVSHIEALSRGYTDRLRRAGHRVVGPSAAGAQLEASKARGKEFCAAHGIPVPAYETFSDPVKAKEYVRSVPYACVVKADGLTPDGDGAVVCGSAAEAAEAVDRFAELYGDDLQLVVEERLTGPEISVFALVDGRSALLFPPALDFKRALEGDRGTNCDGMGSIAPHPYDCPGLRDTLHHVLLRPLLRGLAADGLDYTGFLYFGAVLTPCGPSVFEINARFGDSEAEVVLPGVRSDFTRLCRAVLDHRLHTQRLETDGLARCSVALVQGSLDPELPEPLAGWPFGRFQPGQAVTGLDERGPDDDGSVVFCANVRRDAAGVPRSSGGRVLHVVGSGATPEGARASAYGRIGRIGFPGMRYRADIGASALAASAGMAEVRS
jgi:phosphoribosylamine---glycine ligase